MAQALREWLPLVLQSVQPWMSKSDISAGDRWQQALGKELEECRFGILCITQESLASPWLTFEAGSLAKTASDSRVIPLLLDIELPDLSGPLAQFQAKKADKGDVKEVLEAINRATDMPVQETTIDELFGMLWPKLEAKLQAIPVETGDVAPKRQTGEILEDVVSSMRSLEAHVRQLSNRVINSATYQRGTLTASGIPRRLPPSPDYATVVYDPVSVGLPIDYGTSLYDLQRDVLSVTESFVVTGFRQGRSLNEMAADLEIPTDAVEKILMVANRKIKRANLVAHSADSKDEPTDQEEKTNA
jgi:hypothetical protein